MFKVKSIRSDTLKIIAMICMFIDHAGVGIVERLYLFETNYETAIMLRNIDEVMRFIGRIAMPIFCYQLVMGLFYTKNRMKYLRNLFLFALISQIPFNLIVSGTWFDLKCQNTIFMLFLGALMIYLIEEFKDSPYAIFATVISVVLCASLSELIHADYGAKGVLLIAAIYFLRNKRELMVTVSPVVYILAAILVMSLNKSSLHAIISYIEYESPFVFAFPLIYMDNGKRRSGRLIKWSGYVFYPLHLILIQVVYLCIS